MDNSPSLRMLLILKATLKAISNNSSPIILTGGAVKTNISEARIMHNWLNKNGVKNSRIIIEDNARSTQENATNVSRLAKKKEV